MTIHRFLKAVTTTAMLAATLAVMPACAATGPRGAVYVRIGPPAPIVERRVVAPGPGYVWIPGYHVWNGRAYVWRGGRWDRPPRAGARWVAPRWVHNRRNGWYLVEGHWR